LDGVWLLMAWSQAVQNKWLAQGFLRSRQDSALV